MKIRKLKSNMRRTNKVLAKNMAFHGIKDNELLGVIETQIACIALRAKRNRLARRIAKKAKKSRK